MDEGSTCHTSGPEMAITNVVPFGDPISKKNYVVQEKTGELIPSTEGIDYREFNQYPIGSMPLLDQNLRRQGFGKSEIRFMNEESLEVKHEEDILKLSQTVGAILRTL